MADKKLSALTAAAAGDLASTDVLSGLVGVNSRKIPLSVLAAYLATATLAAGVLTASAPMTLTQTWNAGGVTFRGKENVFTITAAAADSTVERWLGGAAGTTVLASLSSAGVFTTTEVDAATIGKINGNLLLQATGGGRIAVNADSGVNFVATQLDFSPASTTVDLSFVRDAAGTLAQRSGTNAQTYNWYGNYVSATDYHRGALKVAKATLSGVTGATVTSTNLIPIGAVVIGVTTKVTTGLGVTNGTTGYAVGDGTDPNRWGDVAGTAAGTSSDNTNATATGVTLFTAANNVVLTAAGGNFDGTGVIDVNVFYLIAQAD